MGSLFEAIEAEEAEVGGRVGQLEVQTGRVDRAAGETHAAGDHP
jgi:hypothetical protein